MVKKLLAALLAAAAVANMVTAFAWEPVKEDTDDNARRLLYTLDIMDTVTSKGHKDDDKITRGELADIVMRLSGLYENRIYAKIFDDVDENSAYAASISNLVNMGVIAQADNFYPDDTALYEHAVKMIVYLLGYDVEAEYNGGWLQPVMRIASDIGLTKGIAATAGQELNAGMLNALCYNALDCEMLTRDLNNDFTKENDKTLLTEKFDIYKQKGIVEATSETSLTGSGKSEIARVGTTELTDADNLAADYLGMEAIAYYHVDDAKNNNLVFISPTDKNNITTVSADDLALDEAGTSYTSIYYEDSETEKVRKIRIDEEADVIYNGNAFPSYTLDDYEIEAGFVKFLDNDGDSMADVVFIEAVENYVVDSINASDNQIYDMYGKYLDLDDCENLKIVDMYGKTLKLSELSKWNVLSVRQSKDGSLVTIKVYNDPVVGDVQSISTENGERKVTIDGDTFAVAKSYEEALQKRNANAKEIVLSQSGTYYLDEQEKIAAVSLDTVNSWRYGFLIKAYYDEGDERAGFKLIYDNTGMKRFEAADSVTIDGSKKEDDKIASYFYDAGGDTIPQLIKFMTNGQGYIRKVDTAAQGSNETSQNLTPSFIGATGYWSIRTRRVGNGDTVGVQIDPSATLIFQTPTSSADKYNEDKYSVRTYSFKNNDYLTYDAYDVDSTGLAKAVVIKSDGDSNDSYDNKQMLILTKVDKIVDSDDEVRTVISGYDFNGNTVKETMANDADLLNVKAGDIVAYTYNYKNEIEKFVYVYHHESGTVSGKSIGTGFIVGDKDIGADYNQSYKLFYTTGDSNQAFSSNSQSYLTANVIADKLGGVIKAYQPGVFFATGDPDDLANVQIYEQSCPFYTSSPASVFLCENNKVTTISWGDLEQYVYSRNKTARALLFTTYSQLRAVYIYN